MRKDLRQKHAFNYTPHFWHFNNFVMGVQKKIEKGKFFPQQSSGLCSTPFGVVWLCFFNHGYFETGFTRINTDSWFCKILPFAFLLLPFPEIGSIRLRSELALSLPKGQACFFNYPSI